MATKSKSPEIVQAWQPGVIELPGGGDFQWKKGDRLRADHPAVKKVGAGAFVPDGTPDNELPHPFEGAIASSAEAGREMAARTKFARSRARRSVKLEVDGEPRVIKKGDLLLPTDPVVVLVPNAFEHIEIPQQ